MEVELMPLKVNTKYWLVQCDEQYNQIAGKFKKIYLKK
jgi:hypothetical protein